MKAIPAAVSVKAERRIVLLGLVQGAFAELLQAVFS
jgi:hypothetical protein